MVNYYKKTACLKDSLFILATDVMIQLLLFMLNPSIKGKDTKTKWQWVV